MSLDGFYRGLAAMFADPRLVGSARAGDDRWLDRFSLAQTERARLMTMACDPRIAVNCTLYRSNRLSALVRTVPTLVCGFWDGPRTDMQFRTEGAAFCIFVAERFPELAELAGQAHAGLAASYGA